MRAVFMGSAGLSCPSLTALLDSTLCELVAVVSQPDRVRGRGRSIVGVCPTKVLASERGVDVLSPENVNDPSFVEKLSSYAADIFVVVAYGQILRSAVLSMPEMGCVNVHASLLPKYRGAAPIQWAIANGETVTGVTTMYMNEKMDAGDIIMQRDVPIGCTETAGVLHDRIADAGAILVMDTLKKIADGKAVAIPQDEEGVTIAPKLSRKDGLIDWGMPAETIFNRVRGFNPWPGCWTNIRDAEGCSAVAESEGEGGLLKVWEAEVVDLRGNAGEILAMSGAGPVIAAGDNALRLIKVQPEGGKVMSGGDYMRGHASIRFAGQKCG